MLGRVRRDVPATTVSCWRGIRRPSSNNRQARMNPAGRDASVAPDSIAALSCSVATGRSWLFAGMTEITPVTVSVPDSLSGMAEETMFLATTLNNWMLEYGPDTNAGALAQCQELWPARFMRPPARRIFLSRSVTSSLKSIFLPDGSSSAINSSFPCSTAARTPSKRIRSSLETIS